MDNNIGADADGASEFDGFVAPDATKTADAKKPTQDDGERAGVYLAALVALAVPALIVVALVLPTSAPEVLPPPTSPEVTDTPGAGLDQVEFSNDPEDG